VNVERAGIRWSVTAGRMGAVLLAGLCIAPPLAQASSSELRVSAVVLKVARVQVLSQPASVEITEADVARGYIEVPTPVHVAIRSNTPNGYTLAFDNQADFFRQAHVRGLPTAVQVGASGGVVPQPSAGRAMGNVRLALGFRFDLSQTARAGTYPWPFHLSAEPL